MPNKLGLFTTREVAEHFRVDDSTVRRWVVKEWIKPTVTTAGGYHRFDQSAIDAAEARTSKSKARVA